MKSIERKAGDPIPTIYDVSEVFGDHALLIAPGGPDWVITPPELGSKKLYFKERYLDIFGVCPNCKTEDVEILVAIFRESTLICLETLNCCKQFAWCRDS